MHRQRFTYIKDKRGRVFAARVEFGLVVDNLVESMHLIRSEPDRFFYRQNWGRLWIQLYVSATPERSIRSSTLVNLPFSLTETRSSAPLRRTAHHPSSPLMFHAVFCGGRSSQSVWQSQFSLRWNRRCIRRKSTLALPILPPEEKDQTRSFPIGVQVTCMDSVNEMGCREVVRNVAIISATDHPFLHFLGPESGSLQPRQQSPRVRI